MRLRIFLRHGVVGGWYVISCVWFVVVVLFFFFSSRRRHTRCLSDWSSDVCSSDLAGPLGARWRLPRRGGGGRAGPCRADRGDPGGATGRAGGSQPAVAPCRPRRAAGSRGRGGRSRRTPVAPIGRGAEPRGDLHSLFPDPRGRAPCGVKARPCTASASWRSRRLPIISPASWSWCLLSW